jgi:2-polyprenyl-3-methyl-5-hydroxy-6-metoxy-1,4-benzoquinol methylase
MKSIELYNRDNQEYDRLVEQLYLENPAITLPQEYAFFIKENLLQFLVRLARYKFVSKMIKKTDHLLEIGCGSGLGSVFLAQNCASVLGIDVKANEIEEANSLNRRTNLTFKNIDFFDFVSDQRFDVVVALDVIEHMSKCLGRKLIKKTRRYLRNNGLLVIGTPSAYSSKYQGALSKASHIKLYDRDELVKLVEECYGRSLGFSMNDEIVHTGFPKMAWYYFVLAFCPKGES